MRKKTLPALLLLGLLLPLPALAELGGDENTVQNDRVQMKATMRTQRAETFSVHEITAANGCTVREYVSPQGKIFGVAWSGQTMPDLKQLLGPYYDQVSQARAKQTQRFTRGPINIQESGIVFQQSGHMRSYFGRAYVPSMVPQGVAPESVR